jgi:hypothetical protein
MQAAHDNLVASCIVYNEKRMIRLLHPTQRNKLVLSPITEIADDGFGTIT